MFKIQNLYNKKFLIFTAILVIALAVYLNRAYAHIYGVLGAAELKLVAGQEIHMINNMATSSNNAIAGSLVYAALGDSLSAGVGTEDYKEILPYLLAEKFSDGKKSATLKNHSVPGVETIGVITYLLPEAINDNPDIVTVLIGVNDIHNKVSADVFAKNYEEILSRLTKETKATVYAISIPFIGASSLMLPPYQALFDARTRQFNVIIKNLAAKYSVKYIDLYTPTVELFKRPGSHYSKDLFHPSASGYKLWADTIYDNIN